MSKGDEPIELFESTAWDDADESSDPPPADLEPTRPRWVVPAFVTALALAVGGIAVGVATRDDASSPQPSAVDTQSTAVGEANSPSPTVSATIIPPTLPEFPPPLFPADPTIANGSLIPKYVVDVPAGLNVAESRMIRQPADPLRPALWAAPNSGARSGRWVTVLRVDGGANGRLASPQSYRLSLPSIEAAVAPPTALRPTTQLAIQSRGDLLVVEAFGFDESSIPDLVAAVAAGGDALSRGAATADLRELDGGSLSEIPSVAEVSRLVTIVGPIPADATTVQQTQIQLRVSLPATNSRRLEAFRLTDIRRLAIGYDTAAVAGNLANQPGFGSVTWLDSDGWELQLTGTLPVDTLIELAGTARVDDQLWDIFSTAASPRSPVSMTSSPVVEVATLAAGGRSSTIWLAAHAETVSNSSWLTWQLTFDPRESVFGLDFIEGDAPVVSTAVVNSVTYVFASVPASDASLTLRVTLPSGETRDVALQNGVYGPLELAVAATAFDEPGPYSAEVVDAAGTVLASWPAR